MSVLIFDRIIIVLFICAAIRHAADQNWPKSAYWLSAAMLNVAILFMGK